MAYIPLSVPNMGEKEKEYAQDAIATGWVSSVGAYVNRFEEELSEYVNSKNAVACQSGTAGLHLSLLALGVERDDLVIVPTLTFIAAVNPVKYVGAEPVFMDCDDSLCIDPQKLRSFCIECCYVENNSLYHKDTNKRIPAIIIVHVFGNMADMKSIMEIAEEFHLSVLEDATESLGSKYIAGKLNGMYSGTIGDVGVYSFNGNKIITTGGGGMVVTNNEIIAKKIKYWSTQSKDDELFFTHNEIGYNYRMTNVQAAIGVGQLEQLERFIKTKKDNFYYYNELLKNTENIRILPFDMKIRPNYWFYTAVINFNALDTSVKKLIDFMQEKKIQIRPVWKLNHTQKPYIGDIAYSIDTAYKMEEGVVNLPCSSSLTFDNVEYVCQCLKAFLTKE